MSEPIETIKFPRGLVGKIFTDEDPPNPRTEYDNLGTMVCFHGRYILGDLNHGYSSSDFNGWDALHAGIVKEHGPCIILPLYLYDHSGITMNTTGFACPWDSGQVGFIFVSHETLRGEFGWQAVSKKRQAQAKLWLEGEVETYNQFLTGEVYGIVLEDRDETELQSCWGYYGLKDAKEELESWAKSEVKSLPALLPGFEEAASNE